MQLLPGNCLHGKSWCSLSGLRSDYLCKHLTNYALPKYAHNMKLSLTTTKNTNQTYFGILQIWTDSENFFEACNSNARTLNAC